MLGLGDEPFPIVGNKAVILSQNLERDIAAEALIDRPVDRGETRQIRLGATIR